ncbi:MAG TPA: MmgE/PrpD family protein, partial [Thermoanaerobaculia bacterium]|nr:MmgE/PrpD family protein [Thermoanaerobaculia bacterium]
MFRIEDDARAEGHRLIAGVDEVGRGCLAGPVYAGAVAFEGPEPLLGLDDSKALPPEVREDLAVRIRAAAAGAAVGAATAAEIDALGIVDATLLAMRRALENLALAGATQPDVEAVAALARTTGGAAQSRLWACGSKVPAAEAAFVNALAASALDYDSLHDNVHPEAIALPVAWAVASAMRASGEEFLRAYILGTEAICRLAESAEGPQKGWTIGAVVGTFGAALTASLLLAHSPDATAHALGLCL